MLSFFFPIDTVLKNPSEQFEVLRGTFKLGMVYGLRTRTMATRANMRITEAGLVMIDFFFISIFAFCFLIRFNKNC